MSLEEVNISIYKKIYEQSLQMFRENKQEASILFYDNTIKMIKNFTNCNDNVAEVIFYDKLTSFLKKKCHQKTILNEWGQNLLKEKQNKQLRVEKNNSKNCIKTLQKDNTIASKKINLHVRKIKKIEKTVIRQAAEITILKDTPYEPDTKDEQQGKRYYIPEFVDIENLKWEDLTFYFYYKKYRKNGKILHKTLIKVTAKTKNVIITTGKKDLSYFRFKTRSTKKSSILFKVLQELRDGHMYYMMHKKSLLHNNDPCNRFCLHLRMLFPTVKNNRPIPVFKKNIFPQPKFTIIDKENEREEKKEKEEISKNLSKKNAIEAFDLLKY